MVDPKKPTRNVLAKLFPDNETRKSFEQLFDIIQPLTEVSSQDIREEAGSANAKAQLSLDLLESIKDTLELIALSPDKGGQALDAINNLSDSINALALAPRQEHQNFACLDWLQLNTEAPAPYSTPGVFSWNEQDRCPEYVTGVGNTIQIGQELWGNGVNKTGGTAADGKAVYASGVQGQRFTYDYADARDKVKSGFVGVVTASTDNNEEGPVTVFGLVRDIDTSSFSPGDKLYIAADATGDLTNTPPTAPDYVVQVAIVVTSSSTQGTIFVNPRLDWGNGVTLNSLAVKTTFKAGDIASGDYTETELDGTLVFNGDATTYDDWVLALLRGRLTGASNPTLTTMVGNVEQFTFDINDEVMLNTETTHSFKEGSMAEMHVHWVTNGSDGTDRTVKWEVEYSIANLDATAPFTSQFPATTTITAETTIPASTPDLSHIYTSFGALDLSGFNIGAYIVMRFRRIASSGTEPSSDPFGLALGIHFEQDTTGSRSTTGK